MSNLVSSLGLNLKRKFRRSPDSDDSAIGKMIIKDAEKLNKSADRQDFSNYTKNKYHEMLQDAVNDGVKKTSRDFYIEITFNKDRLIKRAFRMVPNIRYSCPIPFYHKDLFFYNKKEDKLDLLWSIPEKRICENVHLLNIGVPGNDKLIEHIENFNSGLYFTIYEKLKEVR